MKKALNIIFKLLQSLIYLVLILFIIVIAIQRFSNNKVTVGGIQIYSVSSGSMVPKYNIGDILIVKSMDTYEVGDCVTYIGSDSTNYGIIITHKIISKEENEGEITYVTKGIANEIPDPPIKEKNIYGKVIYKTWLFSYLGKLMKNIVSYYIIFVVVGVTCSYQLIKYLFIKDDDESEIDEDERRNNKKTKNTKKTKKINKNR